MVHLSTIWVRIFNPLQFFVMRFPLSCTPLLALELFYTKIVIHQNCNFSKLFHLCSHVIGHWWCSIGRTAFPTSRTISRTLRLTWVKWLESKVSLCPRGLICKLLFDTSSSIYLVHFFIALWSTWVCKDIRHKCFGVFVWSWNLRFTCFLSKLAYPWLSCLHTNASISRSSQAALA